MTLKRFSVLVIISFIASSVFFTGKYFYGDLFMAEMFPKETLMERAKKGDASAQYEIAYRYDTGVFGENNEQQAFIWYQKSAAQNNASAQNNLGVLYLKGRGTKKDLVRAFEFFKKAAAQDLDIAKMNLAYLYYNGLTAESNYTFEYEKALPLYLEQAKNGNSLAQNRVGYMYEKGQGTNIDSVKATYWYTKGAENGGIISRYNLALAYNAGRGVPKNYLTAGYHYKVAADQGHKEAKEYYEKKRRKCILSTRSKACLLAMGSQDARVAYRIGVMYDAGYIVDKDAIKAVEWYLKAAKKGHIEAQLKVRKAYYTGRGVEKDPIEGYAWDAVLRERAADTLGIFYLKRHFKRPKNMRHDALDQFSQDAADAKADAYIKAYGHSLEKVYFKEVGSDDIYRDEYTLWENVQAKIAQNKAAYEAIRKDDFHHKDKAFQPPNVDFGIAEIDYERITIQRIGGGVPDLYCDTRNCHHSFLIHDDHHNYKTLAKTQTNEVYKANCLKDSFFVFAGDAGDKPVVSIWKFEDQQIVQATQVDELDIKAICSAWVKYKNKTEGIKSLSR